MKFTIVRLISFGILLLLVNQAITAEEKKTLIAYSLKVAELRVQKAIQKKGDFRQNQPDLFYLGYISKPWAVIVDNQNNDCLLIGEWDAKLPRLSLDDWVVALRTRFTHEEDPGVTIDPCPCVACIQAGEKAKCRHYTKQSVRFFAGVENTRFGQACYEADWLMKRISLGTEKVSVDGLETFYDLELREAREAGKKAAFLSILLAARFWFYPLVNRVNVTGDTVFLEKFKMALLTEVMYAEVNGQPVQNLGQFSAPPAEGFARSFTEKYDDLSKVFEPIGILGGLSRLAALAKGLTICEHKPDLEYFLKRYIVQEVVTPKEAEVLSVTYQVGQLNGKIEGGVRLMGLAQHFLQGDAQAFRNLVFDTRPLPDKLTWQFTIAFANGQLAGIILPQDTGDTQIINDLKVRASFFKEQKLWDQALLYYEKILVHNPKDSEAYGNGGAMLWEMKRYREALQWLDRAILENPQAWIYVDRGNVLDDMGRSEDAIKDYDRAILLSPDLATAYYNRGLALQRASHTNAALADFQKALQLNPKDYKSAIWEAQIYVYSGQMEIARKNLESLESIIGATAGSYFLRAEIARLNNDKKAAVLALNKAIELDPYHPEALLQRAAILQSLITEKSNLKLADELFRPFQTPTGMTGTRCIYDVLICNLDRVILTGNRLAEAYLNRGVARSHDGRVKAAREDYKIAISLSSGNSECGVRARNNLETSLREDCIPLSLMVCDITIDSHPSSPCIYVRRAHLYEDMGKVDEALEDYDRALEADPKHVNVYIDRGDLYLAKGNISAAIADYSKCLEYDPIHMHCHRKRGNAYFLAGRHEAALQDFNKAVETEPFDAAAYLLRARVLLSLGNSIAAMNSLEQAISVDRDGAIRKESQKILEQIGKDKK